MTGREKNLKIFLEDILKQSSEILNDINLKNPLKQIREEQFEFKNKFFNKSYISDKNDFREFFSRKEVKSQIENIEDLNCRSVFGCRISSCDGTRHKNRCFKCFAGAI